MPNLKGTVPYCRQQGANHCWFACCLMVLYYGTSTDPQTDYNKDRATVVESDLYNTYKNMAGNPFCNGAGGDFVESVLKQVLGLNYQDSVIQAGDTGNAVSIIRASLSADRPVILGFNRGNSGGHYVVVTGIDDNNLLTILDPQNLENTQMVLPAGNFDILYPAR